MGSSRSSSALTLQRFVVDVLKDFKAWIQWNFDGSKLLGSKDLGTNVFRTLICNVGKPWSKQVFVLF